MFMLHDDYCSRSLSPLPYFQIGGCVCVCVCVCACVCVCVGGTIFFYFVKLLSLKIPAQEPSPIACDNKQGSLICCTGPHRKLYKPDLMQNGKKGSFSVFHRHQSIPRKLTTVKSNNQSNRWPKASLTHSSIKQQPV